MLKQILIDEDSAPIIMRGDPILKQVSLPVTEFDSALTTLATTMMTTMANRGGRGLAAVQIGVLQRVIVATTIPSRSGPTELYVMVNPVITRALGRCTIEREGCLSIPGVGRMVSRPAKCEVTWQDLTGQSHSKGFSGELARVIQHEMDHLEGILITDKPLI
jgi:peptide deformylase